MTATCPAHLILFNFMILKVERCTLWSTLKFRRCSFHHITGDDVSRTTKGIRNATLSKARMEITVTVATI
jgi:hypothetical protein